MSKLVTTFIKDDSGATAIEYGLIAGIVSISIIGSLQLLQPQLTAIFTKVTAALTDAAK